MEKINPMTLEHIDTVIDIHLRSFKGFFSSFLGREFLSLEYREVVTSPLGAGFVYFEDSCIVGFVCGMTMPGQFFSAFMKRNWLRLGWIAMKKIFRRPKILPKIMRGLFYSGKNPGEPDVGGLFSIAVLSEQRVKGIGKILVHSFLAEMKKRGMKEVYLSTDKVENESVNEFYRKLGFSLRKTHVTPEGRKINEYFIKI